MGILAVAAGFNLTNIDFAVEFHADEPTKVEFIQRSTQNFYHPLLMLQLVRAVNLAAGFMDSMAIATLGRALMGLCGVATVFGAYLLGVPCHRRPPSRPRLPSPSRRRSSSTRTT
jgi:hypothetical protein